MSRISPSIARCGFAAVLFVLACAKTDGVSPDKVSVVIDTIAGVERITSSGDAPRWTLTPILEVFDTWVSGGR